MKGLGVLTKMDCTREQIVGDIVAPYFFAEDGLPGLDFNRELVEPGTNETFPNGAVGIRVDDDFWAVAALPLTYRDVALADIVRALWPQYADKAVIAPDSGSVEQKLHFMEQYAKSAERKAKHYWEALKRREEELKRLRRERPGLHERHESRYRAECDYFVRQYEHLLVAMAHRFVPRIQAKGVCAKCGLYSSDRVHMQHYIDLKSTGHAPAMKHLVEYGETDKLD